MHNKNKLFSEISRMIELTEHATGKSEIIKESISQKILKEDEDIWGDTFDDDNFGGDDFSGDDGSGKGPLPGVPKEDIPEVLKIALLSKNVNEFQKVALGLDNDKIIKVGDLYSKRIERPRADLEASAEGSVTPDESGDGVTPSRGLYPKMSADEFKSWISKSTQGTRYVVSPKEADSMYKWMKGVRGRGDYNNVGFDTSGKISEKGNATLSFLGKVMSGKGLNESDKKILSILNPQAAAQNAVEILRGYYRLVADNQLMPLLNMSPTPKNIERFEIAIDNTLDKLGSEKGFDPSRGNLTSWFLQVVKNDIKNQLKADTDYVPDPMGARDYLENKFEQEGKIKIASKVDMKGKTSADRVEEGRGTYKYIYVYEGPRAVEDFLGDLVSATKQGDGHPFKSYNLSPLQNKQLFQSKPKYPVGVIPGTEEEFAGEQGYEDIGMASLGEREAEVKKIASDAVEWMVKNKDYKGSDRVTKSFSKYPAEGTMKDPKKYEKWESSAAPRIQKLAHDNLVNLIYNFLLTPMAGKTKIDGQEFRDIEASGKIDADVMKGWLESQNKKMLDALTSLSDKSPEEVKDLAIKNKLLLGLKGDGEFDENAIQSYFNGLMAYLKSNPDAVNTLKSVGQTSPEGEELGVDLKLEQRLRARIKKIISESFVISEEEEDFDIEDLDDKIRVYGEKFAHLLKGQENSPEEFYQDIKNAINGIPVKWNYENGANTGAHNFISSVVASLYNDLSAEKQNNVIRYVFLSFFPNQENSRMIRELSSKLSGGDYYAKKDIAWEGVVNVEDNGNLTIQNALESFNPTKGAPFSSLLFVVIFNAARNILRGKSYSYKEKDERFYRSSDKSIDDPMGDDSNETFASSIKDTSDDKSSKDEALQQLNMLIQIAKDNNILSKTEILFLDKALSYGAEIMDEDGINPQLFATRLSEELEKDISVSNVNSTLSNLRKKMKEAKDKGLF